VVNGTTKLHASLAGKTYIQGHIYRNNKNHVIDSHGTFLPYTDRGNLADSSGRYFTKTLPQYDDYPPSAFVSIKAVGAKGMVAKPSLRSLDESISDD
jgi:glucan 1,3-beta-glucosidase